MLKFLRLLLTLLAILAPISAANAEWREATSEHFVVVSGGSEAQLVRMSQRLEAVHWLMTLVTGVTQVDNGAKVRIYLVDDISDVHAAMGVRGNSDIAGFYRPSTEGAIAIVPRSEGAFSTTILFHEYAHHFMLQYMRSAYPAWYVEGFAEVLSTASFEREGIISYGKTAIHRAYELYGGERWVPASRMFAPRSATDQRAGIASYGQYWLTAHYFIFAADRRGQLRQFIQAINQGRSQEEAYSVFTGGIEQVNTDLRRYLRRNSFLYQPVPLPPEVMTAPIVRIMRPGEAAIIDDELQAARPMSAEDHLPVITRVAAIAARYPDDPAVAMLLARLHYYAGHYVEAEAAADRVLALEPANVRALTLKGQVMLEGRDDSGDAMDAAFVRRARSFIIRANRANPEDQMPLIAYFNSFRLAGEEAPAVALDGLFKASRLVPQEPGLRMMLAQELLQRRNLPAARILLAPLAYAPHQSQQQGYALQLLQWIDDGAEGGPPIFVPEPEVTVEGS